MATSHASLYDHLPLNSREIRLLHIIGLEEDCTRWGLKVVSLDCNPRFTALSYVWGDQSQNEKININGQDVVVTASLAHALHHCMNAWASIYKEPGLSGFRIWADAVCINQADMSERSEQVRVMGSIYSSAEFVLSWLGLESQYKNYLGWGMDTFATLAAAMRRLSIDELLKFDWLPQHALFCWDHEDLGHTRNTRWSGTVHLMELKYWTRVWIYQEIVLPKKVYLFASSRHVLLDELLYANQQLTALRAAVLKSDTPKPSHLDDSIWFNFFGANSADPWAPLTSVSEGRRKLHQDNDVSQTVDNVKRDQCDLAFIIARELEATNPKDLIYGLLGVLNLDMIPDYSLATAVTNVYGDFIRAYLDHCERSQQPQSLDFLAYSGIGIFEGPATSFPSWTPNFSALQYEGFDGHDNADYDAGKGIFDPNKPEVTIQGQELCVQGMEVDSVISVDVMELKFNPNEDRGTIFSVLKQVFCQMTPTFRSLDGTNPIVAVYRLLASIHPVSHYRPDTRESDGIFLIRVETLLDTLRALNLDELRAADPKADATSKRNYLTADYGDPSNPPLFIENPRRYVEHVVGSLVREHQDPFMLETMIAIIEIAKQQIKHTIFRMSKDYLGVARQPCMKNDKVCILRGSKYPVILRKEADHYVHIGTCIIPGLMDGEAKDLAKANNDSVQVLNIR